MQRDEIVHRLNGMKQQISDIRKDIDIFQSGQVYLRLLNCIESEIQAFEERFEAATTTRVAPSSPSLSSAEVATEPLEGEKQSTVPSTEDGGDHPLEAVTLLKP